MTQLSHKKVVKANLQHIYFDCGSNLNDFDEVKLLDNYSKFKFRNLQGSHWAPHLIHVDLWKKMIKISKKFLVLEWKWVKAHNGDPMNEAVDTLARKTAELIKTTV